MHTTTDRSPEELHQTGLDIIEELRAEYAEIGGRVLGTDDLGAIFQHLRFDEDMRWTSEDELLRDARAAIERLPERTRTVFLMHRFAGLKYRDIGTRLGISVSAVEKHIARASISLLNWIDDEGDEAQQNGQAPKPAKCAATR